MSRSCFLTIGELRELLAGLPAHATVTLDGLPDDPNVTSRGFLVDVGDGLKPIECIDETRLSHVRAVVLCDVAGSNKDPSNVPASTVARS